MRGGLSRFHRAASACACLGFVLLMGGIAPSHAVEANGGVDDAAATSQLSQLPLSQLANLQVTSVSKMPQSLQQAAATIYVITHEQILRAGATSLPEALRLAPNLQVTQLSATQYTVAARGMGGNPIDQNFSNKLLMLIDGRSVYSPLYSGIYLDAQQVVLDDVDRIEVISGPGATLWGANAINGVINVVTRSAYDSQGAQVRLNMGSRDRQAQARYGGELSGDIAYRVYASAGAHDALESAAGANAGDQWSKVQGGFRTDWSHANDLTTVQGDIYRAPEGSFGQPDGLISGGNLLARWQRTWQSGANLQLQAYMDQSARYSSGDAPAFVLHAYDFELQHSWLPTRNQQVVWGAGERVNDYQITNGATLLFLPPARTLTLGNLFAQDTISLSHGLRLVAGLKLENDPYAGWSPLPDLRLSWEPDPLTTLWVAASKAIRSPTPFDEDVVEKLGSLVYLTGNSNFHSEKVDAMELGYRVQAAAVLSLSASLYYSRYYDLRTIEFGNTPSLLPLQWGNLMAGDTYGVEFWADWQPLSWWRLSPGLRTAREHWYFEPGASALTGLAQVGDDPGQQWSLTSSMDLPAHLQFDTTLRYVSALSQPALSGYYELGTRLGWQATPSIEVALVGANLLQARHLEFPAPNGEYVVRSVMAELRWQP